MHFLLFPYLILTLYWCNGLHLKNHINRFFFICHCAAVQKKQAHTYSQYE